MQTRVQRLVSAARRAAPALAVWRGRLTKLGRRALRRADPAAPDPRLPVPAVFVACRGAFADFGRESDERFTELSRALFEISNTLRLCQTGTRALAALAAGEDPEQALASARTLYKGAIDLVHASIGLALSEASLILEVENKLLAACHSRADFQQSHLHFGVVTTGIRIESSRLPADEQSIFGVVAQQIADINRRVAASTERAFARITEIIASARAERADLATLEHQLRSGSLRSMDVIQNELDALAALLAPCAERGRALDERFLALQPRVQSLVAAIQAQDIVRQKLEHVGAGLDDIAQHFARHAEATPPFEPPFVARAARLQREQLREARHAIEGAAGGLATGLRELTGAADEIHAEISLLSANSVAALRDCRVPALFEKEIEELAHIAQLARSAHDKITTLVGHIQEVITVFFQEIQSLGYDVKLVSLNAQICSERTVNAQALNCLASEASHLADLNSTTTGKLAGHLADCLENLRRIKGEASDFLQLIEEEKGTLDAGFRDVAAKLGRLCSRGAAEMDEASAHFESANRRIHELLDTFDFPRLVAACFGPSEKLSEELLALAEDTLAHEAELSEHAAHTLSRHERRYTMKSENALHRAIVEGKALPAPAAALPLAAAGAAAALAAPESSGDIELFGAEPDASASADVVSAELSDETPPKPALAAAIPAAASSPAPEPAPAAGKIDDGIELF